MRDRVCKRFQFCYSVCHGALPKWFFRQNFLVTADSKYVPDRTAPLCALILEDQVADFELLAHELERSGFKARCQRVETPEEYLAELPNKPDIILADYALPSFNALKALELLHQSGLDIPFIVLTGMVSEEQVVECMKRGAADYLLKDRLIRLGPAVRRALDESELRRQQRKTEAELKKSNQRFQHLVETVKVIPWELDLKTRLFTYVGPQAVKLLGYPLENWHEKGFWEAHVHPEDRDALAQACASSGALPRDYEFTCRMQNADRGTLSLHCVANVTACNSSAGLLCGFMMDITELKTMQLTLARHAEDLARSNAELKQFANAASHDLQEPLRMVAFYTQLLAKRYKGRLDSDADEFIGYAVEGASRMGDLIRHLLEYSRASTKKPSFAQIDCEDVFRGSMANLRLAVNESGAIVTHDALPVVTADASQIGQVLQNLVGNAIKFCGHKAPQVHVSAQEEQTDWHFSVRDNGIGIEAQYFDSIFVIFQRLHSREEYQGSGVGLATCRRIVEQHRGRIWLESEPGAGTTFHFTIPKDCQHQY